MTQNRINGQHVSELTMFDFIAYHLFDDTGEKNEIMIDGRASPWLMQVLAAVMVAHDKHYKPCEELIAGNTLIKF